jgi:hypothetical protein
MALVKEPKPSYQEGSNMTSEETSSKYKVMGF